MTRANWVVLYPRRAKWLCVPMSHDGYPSCVGVELYRCMNPVDGGPCLTELLEDMLLCPVSPFAGDSMEGLENLLTEHIPTSLPRSWNTPAGKAECLMYDRYNGNPVAHWAHAIASIGPKAFMPAYVDEPTGADFISAVCGLVPETVVISRQLFTLVPSLSPIDLIGVDYNYLIDADRRCLHIFRAFESNVRRMEFSNAFNVSFFGELLGIVELTLPPDKFRNQIEKL